MEIVRESPDGAKELLYTSGFKGLMYPITGLPFDDTRLPHLIVGKKYMMMCTMDPPIDPMQIPEGCNRVTLIDGALRYEVVYAGIIFGTAKAQSFRLYSGVNAFGAVIMSVNSINGFFVARPHWTE